MQSAIRQIENPRYDVRASTLIPSRHRPHPSGRIRGSGADGVGNLVNADVAIEEEVVETLPMKTVSLGSPLLPSAVGDLVRSLISARWSRGSLGKRRPIVARNISALRLLDELQRARRITDSARNEAARFAVWQRPSGGSAEIVVNPDAMRGRRQGCGRRGQLETWAGVIHGVGSPLPVGRPTDADLNRVRGTFQDFGNGAPIGNAAGDADNQVGIRRAASDVTVEIIVPRQLILIIARRVGCGRVHVVVIAREEIEAESELFHLRGAFDSLRPRFRAGEGGQQQTGQNGDDGDDDQQLDQSEGPAGGSGTRKSRVRVHIQLVTRFVLQR